MKIVYCLNVNTNIEKLLFTIDKINTALDTPEIFVVSNGVTSVNNLPKNINFKYFGSNQGWQLGALNGCLQAIKFAAENIVNFENTALIFSHEDVYPADTFIINSLIEKIKAYDLICRKYIGSVHKSNTNTLYYMIENIILNGNILSKFKDLPFVETLVNNYGAEETFGEIIKKLNLNVYEINIEQNYDSKINEMGFIHNHKH